MCATWVRFDLLAFGAELCGLVMCADSKYGTGLASYGVIVKDFQQQSLI